MFEPLPVCLEVFGDGDSELPEEALGRLDAVSPSEGSVSPEEFVAAFSGEYHFDLLGGVCTECEGWE